MNHGIGRLARTFAAAPLVIVALIILGGPPAAAEPIAPWMPSTGLSELEQKRLEHKKRARCIPETQQVRWPVYPGAVLLDIDWGRMAPECTPRDGWHDLGGLRLLSRDEAGAVRRYYAEQLPAYSRFDDGPETLFIAQPIEDFLWERDYHKHANVAIRPAPPRWAAAGYRVMIEFNRPAPP